MESSFRISILSANSFISFSVIKSSNTSSRCFALTHVKNFVNETIHLSEVFASSFFTVTFFSFFIGLSAFLLFFVSTTGVVFCAMISAFGAIFLVVNFFVGCAFVT